jgi:hypothetical protein
MGRNDNLRPIAQGQLPYSANDDPVKYLRIATVSRVDYETGAVDIEWKEGDRSIRTFIYMPSAYGSPRAGIRGMPEVGSVVICGWIRGQTYNWEDPVILGYLDMDLSTFHKYALSRSGKTKDDLVEIKTIREKIGYESLRQKRRKIYPGEIQVESTQGSELYLDDDLYLSNSKLNEIEIRSADQSIRISANQLYSTTQAARTWQGMITREPGQASYMFQPTVLPNGKKVQIVTDNHQPFHLGSLAYTEQRTEIFEKSDGIQLVTEFNSDVNVSEMTPYITQVMGTLVGNDKEDIAKYSKLLRPQIFGTHNATEPAIDYLECLPEDYDYLASAYSLKFNKSKTQIDIDKEGHLFTYFPASSNRHPLGAGRSWESYFAGSIKMVVGAESSSSRSLFLDTKGGIKAVLGSDNTGLSSYIKTQKGVRLEVNAPADDKNAYYIYTNGNYFGHINGDYELNVTGNYKVVVKGKIQEQILGIKEESYINDKNNIYGGSLKSIIIKDVQEKIGYNKDVKIAGNIERSPGVATPATINEVVDKEEIVLGGKDTKLWLGNISEEVMTMGDITRFVTLKNKVGIQDQIVNGNIEQDVSVRGDIKRHVLLKDSVGISDVVDTGNIEENVSIVGDIKRHVTLKNETGIKDTVDTGNIEAEVTVVGDIKNTIDVSGNIKNSVSGAGNIENNVSVGDIKNSTVTGSISDVIVTGNREIKIQAGDFIVIITAGNVAVRTLAGDVDINSVTGKVRVAGMLLVTLQSGVKIEARAPQVNLGPLPGGGVVTGLPFPSTLCYLTGAPHLCSQTVLASI